MVSVEIFELSNGYTKFKCAHSHYCTSTVCIDEDILVDYVELEELVKKADPYQLELFVGMLFDQLVRYDPTNCASYLTYDANQSPEKLGEAINKVFVYLQSPGLSNGWSGEASIAFDAEYTHGGNLSGWEIAAFVHPLTWRKSTPMAYERLFVQICRAWALPHAGYLGRSNLVAMDQC